jgi:acyl-CoA synthetase (AMP-forming)/AMP-acid ligase II
MDRLFLSGSSALPESIFQNWRNLTGFEIVEQFGSSETGRVLSNKLDGKKLAGNEQCQFQCNKIKNKYFRSSWSSNARFNNSFSTKR